MPEIDGKPRSSNLIAHEHIPASSGAQFYWPSSLIDWLMKKSYTSKKKKAKFKRFKIPSFGESVKKQLKHTYTAGRNIKWHNYFAELLTSVWKF